jgi:hypothetical protein
VNTNSCFHHHSQNRICWVWSRSIWCVRRIFSRFAICVELELAWILVAMSTHGSCHCRLSLGKPYTFLLWNLVVKVGNVCQVSSGCDQLFEMGWCVPLTVKSGSHESEMLADDDDASVNLDGSPLLVMGGSSM